jgi:hypothetical protein
MSMEKGERKAKANEEGRRGNRGGRKARKSLEEGERKVKFRRKERQVGLRESRGRR